MTKTVIGMYGDMQVARSVVNDLINAGLDRTNMTVMANDSGGGMGAVTGASDSALVSMGATQEQARLYTQGIKQGNVLIAVEVSDQETSQVQTIMERSGLIDLENRGQQRMTQSSKPSGSGRDAQRSTRSNSDDETIEVVEEEIQIGKRNVETGGVRVNTVIREVPVEEQVRLREEHVQIDRRPVDRPASSADLDSLRDQSIEIRETQEQAVVAKEARVVEEVHISKEVEEHTATVRDTVRKTEVEVEQLGSQGGSTSSRYENFDSGFRTHWQSNYSNSGRGYNEYQPAYQYGYTLANDSRYRGRTWNEIEPNVRRDWESQNQGPWENFKDSIRYSWEQMSGRS